MRIGGLALAYNATVGDWLHMRTNFDEVLAQLVLCESCREARAAHLCRVPSLIESDPISVYGTQGPGDILQSGKEGWNKLTAAA